MNGEWTDADCRDYLKELAGARLEVTEWEAGIIESNQTMLGFSPRKREIIKAMAEKYGDPPGAGDALKKRMKDEG